MKRPLSLFLLLHSYLYIQCQTFERVEVPALFNQMHYSNSTSWGDYDNDGDQDLFITSGEGNQPNEFYRNDGQGRFTAIYNNLINKDVPSFSSAWGDYDNDGWLDLYVANCNYSGSPRGVSNFLFKNNGDGTFEKIINSLLVSHEDPSYACSWADYDNDGWLDLYVVNAYEKRNRLYNNNGDGTFTEITDDPVATFAKHEISCSWSDWDNDGDVDLLVVNTDPYSKSSMYENNGNGTFTKLWNDASRKVLYKCRGSNWADYNNDGLMDLIWIDSQGGGNILFRNDGDGEFTEIGAPNFEASKHQSGNASQTGDFDNDGYLDLIFMHHHGIPPEFHRNNGAGGFDLIENEWTQPNVGYAWSLTATDINLDGYLDIFQTNRFDGYGNGNAEENMLFMNTSTDCNNYSLVSLRGIESNYYGLGARVLLYGTKSDGTTLLQKREMSCISSGGYTTQNGYILHFGLAEMEQIDSLHVLWPSGIRDRYENLPVNQYYIFHEDEEYSLANQEFSISPIRDVACPNDIVQLTVNNPQNEVTWYHDGEIVSNQNTITIPSGQNEVTYIAEDGLCSERRDTFFINNETFSSEIYPNPANDFVTIGITASPASTVGYVRIYDAIGRFVMLYELAFNEGNSLEKIPVSELASGLYILEIEAGCWSSIEKLIVVSER